MKQHVYSRNPIANAISAAFEPMTVLTFFTLYALYRSGLTLIQGTRIFGIFLIFTLLPIIAARLWLMKSKKVSDWDVHDRRQRILPLAILCFILIFNYFLVIVPFDNRLFAGVFLTFCVWLIGFSVITLFWKISGHVGTVALAGAILFYWLGFAAWPVFFIIPLVAWSRILRRDHTPAQAVGGAVYSLLITALMSPVL